MKVTDSKTINDIQKEFHDKYPFLKIEFFEKSHKIGEGTTQSMKVDPFQKIAEIRSKHNTGDLSIDGHLKVSSLEKAFAEKFGLNVQVFRKSGDIWLQTTTTDQWTLSKQNLHGQQSDIKPQAEF